MALACRDQKSVAADSPGKRALGREGAEVAEWVAGSAGAPAQWVRLGRFDLALSDSAKGVVVQQTTGGDSARGETVTATEGAEGRESEGRGGSRAQASKRARGPMGPAVEAEAEAGGSGVQVRSTDGRVSDMSANSSPPKERGSAGSVGSMQGKRGAGLRLGRQEEAQEALDVELGGVETDAEGPAMGESGGGTSRGGGVLTAGGRGRVGANGEGGAGDGAARGAEGGMADADAFMNADVEVSETEVGWGWCMSYVCYVEHGWGGCCDGCCVAGRCWERVLPGTGGCRRRNDDTSRIVIAGAAPVGLGRRGRR